MSNALVAMYRYNTGTPQASSCLVIYTSVAARNALVKRMGLDDLVCIDFLDNLNASSALKAGWARNAAKSGAILGLGLSAM